MPIGRPSPSQLHLPSPPCIASNDYWKRAFDSLEKLAKDQLEAVVSAVKHVSTPSQTVHSIQENIIQAAKQRQKECVGKLCSSKRTTGEVIFLRDIMEKITTWIHKFKEIVDVAVQYDPAHAALPWAGVRFLLQVAVKDVETFVATADNLETITQIMACFRAFEHYYLRQRSGSMVQDPMERALTILYADILEFLARTIRYYQTSTIGIVADQCSYVSAY
jgi:hypothetical protein